MASKVAFFFMPKADIQDTFFPQMNLIQKYCKDLKAAQDLEREKNPNPSILMALRSHINFGLIQ